MSALTVLLLMFPVMAEKLNLPEIGEHHRVVTFEKNENPQNVMIVYTRVDPSCHFVSEGGKPVVDFYWMMDRKTYKPTHPLIKARVRRELRVQPVSAEEFRLELDDVRDLHVKDPRFVVRAIREGGVCAVRTVFPSEQGPVTVDSLYSESKKTWRPPFRKLVSVTINGRDERAREVHLKF